jgi:LytS/YehU family sensor histidine kinase
MKAWLKRYLEFLIGIPLVTVVASFLSSTVAPKGEPATVWYLQLLMAGTYTGAIWLGNYQIVHFFRRRYPDIHQNIKRWIWQFLAGMSYTILVNVLLTMTLPPLRKSCIENPSVFMANLSFALLLTLLVAIAYEMAYFLKKWKESIVEVERYRHANILSQFENLKNQVNPHFLFNSLNTLSALIDENQEKASDFVQHMARVYRYGLVNSEKDLVSLKEELDFIASYNYLLQSRFGNKIRFEIHIASGDTEKLLPPLSLQLLLENAVKHNVISAARPLTISVVSHGDRVCIENNLQRKESVEPSTGIGLKNISLRYAHLSHRVPEIKAEGNTFSVCLPLLNQA